MAYKYNLLKTIPYMPALSLTAPQVLTECNAEVMLALLQITHQIDV